MAEKVTSYTEWQMEKLRSRNIALRYLKESLKDSPEYFLKALGKVARARGMSRVAAGSGVSRERLYGALSTKGNPTWKTLQGVLKELGLSFQVIKNK